MNKTMYRTAMQQIFTEKEEILMKARQMQAQFDAQNTKAVRKHAPRRRALIGFAAAAALLVGGAVTVGAANDWNYGAVFNRYFTEKSGSPVSFDYTGMGLDIGEEIKGEGFTMTVRSVVADSSNVYVALDIALSSEITEQIKPDDSTALGLYLTPEIVNAEDGTTLNCGGSGFPAVRGEDGIWHCISVMDMETGTDLNGKQLQLRHIAEPEMNKELIHIGYNYNSEGEGEEMSLAAPDFDLRYDLSGITVQPGKTVSYGGTLPNDANHNTFDTATVSPFMMRFGSSGIVGVMDSAPKWGPVFGEDADEVSITAVYADGPELALRTLRHGGLNHRITAGRPDGRYDWELVRTYIFDTPVTMDGLTAIRINDNVISLQ